MRNSANFNTDWRFAKTGEIPGTLPENWERVTLPHTWNAIDGQDGGNSPIAAWAFRSMAQMPMCSSGLRIPSRAITRNPTSASTMSIF